MAGLKVCGITRREDLEVCDALGVDAVGINFWSGSKRGVSVEHAQTLLEGSAGGQRVGVFVDHRPSDVLAIARTLRLDAVQPHGDADPEPFAALGLPWVWVVRGTPDLATLRVPTPAPAWILLDAAVPGFGGAGAKTDWTWAARAVAVLAPHPVWLAGGITPDNAAAALAQVRPAGLDVASGTEPPGATGGEKDAARIRALLAAAHAP
ncbi:MAG: phosphoribosylanthranilate isomerase [Nannocystaceae bacterium]|nr:phosphoribosylanthranilate isomerase [bacterium]